jgi:ankyrin repeat protein
VLFKSARIFITVLENTLSAVLNVCLKSVKFFLFLEQCRTKPIECSFYALLSGADVGYVDNNTKRPLLYQACINEDEPIVKMLIKHRANPNQLVDIEVFALK